MYLTRLMFTTAVHNIHNDNPEHLVVCRSRSFCTSWSLFALCRDMGLSIKDYQSKLLPPLHHLEMMVEQKFPLSGNQLHQCHSVLFLLVMLPALFRLHQWTYDEKSHYVYRSCTGSYFYGTEYEILAGNWVSFYRKNLWKLTQLPDSDCEQSHYLEIE